MRQTTTQAVRNLIRDAEAYLGVRREFAPTSSQQWRAITRKLRLAADTSRRMLKLAEDSESTIGRRNV